jgi:predicted PurR-regulated permease PerM
MIAEARDRLKHQSLQDLPRTTLGVLVLLGLTGGAVWVMLPFLPATLWATTIVIAIWPTLKSLEARLWRSRKFAAAVLTLALLLGLIVPLTLAIGALVRNKDEILAGVELLRQLTLPPAPEWLARIPIVGTTAADAWGAMTAQGQGLSASVEPYARQLLAWFAATAGSVAGIVLQFLLTVLIAAILYVNGEKAAGAVTRFAWRLAGEGGLRTR